MVILVCYNSFQVLFCKSAVLQCVNVYFSVDITGCGGYWSDDEGIIISPNWPNPYDHNEVRSILQVFSFASFTDYRSGVESIKCLPLKR